MLFIKKIKFVALVMALVMLSGCSDGGSVSNAATIKTNKFPKTLQINSSSFFRSGTTVDQTAMDEWTTYMKNIYGIQITLNNMAQGVSATDAVSGGSVSGMVYMNSAGMLDLINKGKILPLDTYLAKNKAWNALPDDYKKTFEFNGHIWAIPSSNKIQTNVYSIRTDWLEKVGKEMPKTADQLLDVGKAFAEKDPNGDSIANDYLLGGYTYSLFNPLLNSYGIYINQTNYTSIAYDPTLGCFADTLFKPQAKEALQALRDMLKGKMIDPLTITSPNAIYSNNYNGKYGIYQGDILGGKYGASMSVAQAILGRKLDSYNTAEMEQATSYYDVLPPFSTENPITYSKPNYGYVLTQNTPDPSATINAFVDLLFSSKRSFLDCCYGVSDNYTLRSDNVLVLKYKDEVAKTFPLRPYLVGVPELVLGNDYITVTDEKDIEKVRSAQVSSITKAYRAYEKDYIDTYTKTKQLVKVSPMYQIRSDTFTPNVYGFSRQIDTLMKSLSNETYTIDELLRTYRTWAKSMQVQTILKETNDYLGLPNNQVIE